MTLQTALVGYGYAGKTFHAPLLRSAEGIALSTVVSRDASKVHADLPDVRVCDMETMLADPAIALVVIATPNDTHAPLARQALLAGKHVVIDKPFALDVSEAQGLITLAAERALLLSIFHNRRWDADFLTLRRLIESGDLGAWKQMESRFDRFRPVVRQRWREGAGPGAGLWFDLGPHLLDQVLQLFGQPDWLQADIVAQRAGALSDDGFEVTLGYGERRVRLGASSLVSHRVRRFAVHGDRGSYLKFELDQQESWLKAGLLPGQPGWGEGESAGVLYRQQDEQIEETTILPVPGDYAGYYPAVARAIAGRGANPVEPVEALRVMRLLELATHSAAEGRRLGCESVFV
ncbi:oxidoreductase [Aeromonas simiae]|uniref:Oxidoreductase n=1 Tax=Aeromonas simiae TaxID=218936 RepID=A0A5J6WU65_9GAMM|nr:oxidoreductase [Aeromonas simiae]QFI53418.1 oxidoreductase [Aeromonas simiae]